MTTRSGKTLTAVIAAYRLISFAHQAAAMDGQEYLKFLKIFD
mgnify:CR=1 FL=1